MYWGLLIEKKAEKRIPPEDFRPDIFEDVVKSQKSELERGWRILMTGIIFEVVAAFGISLVSGLEIADLSDKTADSKKRTATLESNNLLLRSNVAALEFRLIEASSNLVKIDPLNQPISDISASVTVYMRTTETGPPQTRPGPQPQNCLVLLEKMNIQNEALGTNRVLCLAGFQCLLLDGAEGFRHFGDTGPAVAYSIHFRTDRLSSSSPRTGYALADHSPITPKHILSNIEALEFDLDFIPRDAELVGGSAEILINATFRKQFQLVSMKPETNFIGRLVGFSAKAIR